MQIYKSSNYENMRKFLQRKKMIAATSIAHLLIDKFVNAKNPTTWNYICADDLKGNGIYDKYNTFCHWRREMVRNGILICMATKSDLSDPKSNKKANMFKYGPQIKKYIEDELYISIHERVDSNNMRVDFVESKVETLTDKIDSKADNSRVEVVESKLETKANVERVENVENKVEILTQEVTKLKKDVEQLAKLLLMAVPPDTPERRKIVEENYLDEDKCFKMLRLV